MKNETELRELDYWVAEHVTQWKPTVDGGVYWDENGMKIITAPNYTTDPAAAMQVLEKCAHKTTPLINHPRFGRQWSLDQYEGRIEGPQAETLPLAICLFAKELFK